MNGKAVIFAAAVCAGLASVVAYTQDNAARPEIRGVVIEAGSGRSVAGVEVSLVRLAEEGRAQPPLATATTDVRGGFRFQPDRFGSYYVQAKKEGYLSAKPSDASAEAVLDKVRPGMELVLRLTVPGRVTGQVVDADTGQPITKVLLAVMRVSYANGRRRVGPPGLVVTPGDNGEFVAGSLVPGNYVIWIVPQTLGPGQVVPHFTDDDLKAVDREYAASYWPVGLDLAAASPLPVASGATVSAGILQLRKEPHYRIHVFVPDTGCAPGEPLSVGESYGDGTYATESRLGETDCGKDFLLRGFAPGTYRIDLDGDNGLSGGAELVVTDHDLEVTAALARGVDVHGEVIAADGAAPPPLADIKITMRRVGRVQSSGDAIEMDKQGKFHIANAPLGRHRVLIDGLPGPYYVKEVRFNGVAAPDRIFSLDGPGALQIVVDDKAAAIEGTVSDDGHPAIRPRMVLVKWPPDSEQVFLSVTRAAGGEDGRFQFPVLAPGEYRILAVSEAAAETLEEPKVLERLLGNAHNVDLAPAAHGRLSLTLTDPAR